MPRELSTTYKLEADLGWTGIGIDAIEKFAESWEEFRPNSKFIAYAVSDTDDQLITLHISGALATIDDEIFELFQGKDKKAGEEIELKTITLNTVLEQNNVEKVDFLSLDIEGAEPAALRGFDIQRYKPDLCCIEFSENEFIMKYFKSNGYELIEKYRKVDKVNFYFRPASLQE